jgi:hypothetical protein
MEISEQVTKILPFFIMFLIGIVFTLYFYDQMTGSHIIRGLVAGMLYVIPFGSLLNALTQGLGAIP